MNKTPCPECGCCDTRIMRVRTLTNGTKRRRLVCQGCTFRWTTHTGPIPKSRVKPPTIGNIGFTEDDIKKILLSTDSTKELALHYKCSTQTIRNIVLGNSFSHIHSNIPRQRPSYSRSEDIKGPACPRCAYWHSDKCSFGFPEARTDLAFAQDCYLYDQLPSETAKTAKSN